ncbi:MAG: putative protein VAC14, partial [Streblomastix strix]
VRALAQERKKDEIRQLINTLRVGFVLSTQANSRKGGLCGMSAVAVALGPDSNLFMMELFPPQIDALRDMDPRVRFYACESLFNTIKAAQETSMIFFSQLFPAFVKLSADTDEMVRSACDMVTKALKEIVVAYPQCLDALNFIPSLVKEFQTFDPSARQYILEWLCLLISIPHAFSLLPHLAMFLPHLLSILADPNIGLQKKAEQILFVFLGEMKNEEE